MRSWLTVTRLLSAVLAIGVLLGGCTLFRSPQAVERELLTAELGHDPVELLQAVSAEESQTDLLDRLEDEGKIAQMLRLVRFGLSHDDEQVVFGAVILMSDQMALPEIEDAVGVVIPRLADAECPVTADDYALPLIGSGDFAALAQVIRRMPEEQAVSFLGSLHRMVRPDAIPALCKLALATEGKVRNAALGDAGMTALYSNQGVPELVATELQLFGLSPAAEPEGVGLPGVLAAALQADLHVEGFAVPVVSCARWLIASRPAVANVPLLRELLGSRHGELRNAAVWAIGSMADEQSALLLEGDRPDKVVSACWLAARARRGDAKAMEQLFAGEIAELTCGLAVASPVRRRAFFAHLLALPADEAVPIVRDLGLWPRGELFESIADPLYDDELLADLEPMLAVTPGVDARVLRMLVASLPCCETTRMADALLAYPADQLFADRAERSYHVHKIGAPYLGHGGVWAFLEVTRPDAFRQRLREGFDSEVPAVRDQCAELLARLGDTERLSELAVWIDSHYHHYSFHGWLSLARDRSVEVRELLHERVSATGVGQEELAALAVALGMPFEVAEKWKVGDDDLAAVRAALLAGDAPKAFLAATEGADSWHLPLLAAWRQPEVTAFLREHRSSLKSMEQVYFFDQMHALAMDDRAKLERMLQPVRDGRYATHSGCSALVAARTHGLAMLPFWIDQLGSNCCKSTFIDEALEHLFGQGSEAFNRCRRNEPASAYLRRTLLPVADRLRWSRLAGGYVVAGR